MGVLLFLCRPRFASKILESKRQQLLERNTHKELPIQQSRQQLLDRGHLWVQWISFNRNLYNTCFRIACFLCLWDQVKSSVSWAVASLG
jgi:hypothetical protein